MHLSIYFTEHRYNTIFLTSKRHSEQVSRVHSEVSQGADTPSTNPQTIGRAQSTGVRGHTTNSSGEQSEKPLAEPTQHSILELQVVHLSLPLGSQPWVQLSQKGILPMAETICQSSQTFAGRISLFRSNWEALTQEPWVIQTIS